MPYTDDDPPRPAKNWSADEKHKCVAAANSVLSRGGSESEAIYACIHAAGRSKRGKKEADMPDILTDIKEMSFDELRSAISSALNPKHDMAMPMMTSTYTWIKEMFADRVIVEVNSNDGGCKLYQIGYSVGADDTITLSEPVEVEMVYQPKPAQAAKAREIKQFHLTEVSLGADGQMHVGGTIIEDQKAPELPEVGTRTMIDGRMLQWNGEVWKPIDQKAAMDTQARNALTDADFAYIDSEGGRHLPMNDAAHVRNALARFEQTQFESDAAKKKARAKLEAAAKRMGIEMSEKAEDAKAGQRMQGKMRDMLAGMMESMTAAMGKMKAMMTWANGEDMPPKEMPPKEMAKKATDAGFTVYRTKEGKLRWLSRSATAFKDKDGEIFRTKALEGAVAEADKANADRGPLMFWHVKGTEIGQCDFQEVLGRFLVESGTFNETPQAQKAAIYLAEAETPFEMSIGYQYKATDRADSVYDWLAIKERSICPPGAAANPWTRFTTTKEVEAMALNEQKKAFLEGVFGAEFVADLVTKAEQDSKELEKKVAFKAEGEEEAFDMKALASTLAEAMKPITEGVKATTEAVTGLQADLKAQAERLDKLEAERKEEAEKAANAPRVAAFYGSRASADPGTVVSKEEAEKAGANGPFGNANPAYPLNNPVGVGR